MNSETIKLSGSESGNSQVTIEYLHENQVVQLKATKNFKPGEMVTVEMSNAIRDIHGNKLDGNGNLQSEPEDSYIFTFEIEK